MGSTQLCTRELHLFARPIYAPCMGDPLAANIAALRRHLDLNQADFAELVEGGQSGVSKWEAGKIRPDAIPLDNMARLAGVSLSRFMKEPWLAPVAQEADQPPVLSASAGETVDITQLDL